MDTLRNIVGYFCTHYPHKSELSKARLTKLVYLADWKSVLSNGHQISSIAWKFNHYGPYVDDVMDMVRRDKEFSTDREWTVFGNPKETVRFNGKNAPAVEPDTKAVADFVIDKTKALNWDGFIKLVYSTYPVLTSERHTTLDLPAIARRYKKDQKATEPLAG